MAGLARRRIAWVGVGLAAVVVLLIVARAMLMRDPVAHAAARHRGLESASASVIRIADDVAEQDVVVRDSSGLSVEFRLRWRLDRPASERLPVFLLLGGHASGKESASLIGDPREFLVASLSYPFTGNERATGFAVVREVPAIRRAIYDTPPAVMLALDYLLDRRDVDSSRVELVGASFGVPFAAVAGAIDQRVRRTWLVQGGGDPRALLYAGLRSEIGFAPARHVVASLANLLASGPRFAPERWVGKIAPRPIVMINTEDDERIPRETAELMHAAARDPKEVVWLPGLHVQPNRPDVLTTLIDAVFSRMR